MQIPKPTVSFVVSMIALSVALSGTSYAAVKLAANSVGSAQIKKNAVTSTKIKSNSISSSKIKDGSIKAADLAKGVIPATGTAGSGISDYKTVLGEEVYAGTGTKPGGVLATATCPAGTKVVGGGGSSPGNKDVTLSESFPGHFTSPTNHVNASSEWTVYFYNNSSTEVAAVRAFAICVK